MQIVGFGGLAEAGKTTAARALAEWAFNVGYHVELEHFAKPLKSAAEIIGCEKGGSFDSLYREFCQWTGNRMRAQHEGWWTGLMAKRMQEYVERERLSLSSGREYLIIIDDIRYANEVELVKNWGGQRIFIDRYRQLKDKMVTEAWRSDISEQLAIDYTSGEGSDESFDCSIVNNESLEQFQRRITEMGPYWAGMIAGEQA